jgi:hypothetical protein
MTIFHLISLPEVELLLHRVYRVPGTIDTLSLIELCVLTAVGTHFAPATIPRQMQRKVFATVCVLMESLSVNEAIYWRLMRVYLYLTMYSIAEKYLSARLFLCEY